MALRVFSVVMAATIVAATKGQEIFNMCQEDHDCEVGYFCFFKQGRSACSRCIDCSIYSRQPARSQCAKSKKECGECIEGYEAEKLSQNEVQDYCQPSASTPKPTPGASPSTFPLGFLLLGLGLAILGAFVLGCLIMRCYRSMKVSPTSSRDPEAPPSTASSPDRAAPEAEGRPEESQPLCNPYPHLAPPPPYSENDSGGGGAVPRRRRRSVSDTPSAPPLESRPGPDGSELTVSGSVSAEVESKQRAVPFNMPDYDRRLPRPVESDDEDGDDGGAELQLGINIDVDFSIPNVPYVNRPSSPTNSDASAATEPSHWRPPPAESPNLPMIDETEESPASSDIPGPGEDGSDIGNLQDLDEIAPTAPQSQGYPVPPELSSPVSPPASFSPGGLSEVESRIADSGVLGTASGDNDDSRRTSLLTSDDCDDTAADPVPPAEFAYQDSALDLTTTRPSSRSSLGNVPNSSSHTDMGPPASSPRMRMSLSSIDVPSGLKRQKSRQSPSPSVSKRRCGGDNTMAFSSEED